MLKRTQEEIMASWKGDVTKPLVSVCTITYNHEKFIAEALDSFLMQETDFPFEIVVDDDCSTDNNAQIIKEYADRFPHIIKANLREKNVGMMANFIANMKRAKGEYIALCEGDDYWTDPLKLQKQVDFLDENEEFSMCYSAATVIDINGKILNANKQYGDHSKENLIAGLGNAITGSVMFRAFNTEELSGSGLVNGDSLLWHTLGFYGKCKLLDGITNSVYRIHDSGVWSGRSDKSRLDVSMKTYINIRNNIIVKFGPTSDLVARHDNIYEIMFVNYFARSILSLNFKNYIFGVSKLKELKHLRRMRIYLVHIKHVISLRFLELKKV